MDIESYDGLDGLPALLRLDIPAADLALLEHAARAIGAVRGEEVNGEGYVNHGSKVGGRAGSAGSAGDLMTTLRFMGYLGKEKAARRMFARGGEGQVSGLAVEIQGLLTTVRRPAPRLSAKRAVNWCRLQRPAIYCARARPA